MKRATLAPAWRPKQGAARSVRMPRKLLLLLTGVAFAAVTVAGCHRPLGSASGLCIRPSLHVGAVDPDLGPPDRALTLTVLGSGFVSTPILHLGTIELAN